MKADEIQTSTRLASGVVLLVSAMLEKGAKKFCGFWVSRARGVGPADSSFGQRAQNCFHTKVVELEVFFRCAFPIVDVRFVPNLPKPRFGFGIAITGAEVPDELKDKVRPLLIVLRRIRPARVNRTLWKVVPVRIDRKSVV